MMNRIGKCPGCGEEVRMQEGWQPRNDFSHNAYEDRMIQRFEVTLSHPSKRTPECEEWIAAISDEIKVYLQSQIKATQANLERVLRHAAVQRDRLGAQRAGNSPGSPT